MALARGLGQSTLARRLLVVFFACVLIPVAALTVVSYLRVRSQLVGQSLARLDLDSKAAQMSMLERLALADDVARAWDFERTRSGADRADQRAPVLSQIVLTDASGAPLGADGTFMRALDSWEEEALQNGTHLFVTDDGRDVRLVHDRPQGRVWATIDSTFLWVAADEYATLRGEATWCVLDASDRPIHCPQGIDPASLLPHQETRTAFTFEYDGRPHRGLMRPLYLQYQFGQEPWHVLIAEPLDVATAVLDGFRRTFLPIALLSIFSVLFFSSLQLRRVFRRLVELRTATLRIADRDFATRVDMDGTDEIADLAGAFDQMTGELSDQFQLLEVINRVDQAALVHRTLDALATDVLIDIGPVFGDAARALFLVSGKTPLGGLRGVASLQVTPHGRPTTVEVTLSPERAEQLSALAVQTALDGDHVLRLIGDPQVEAEVPDAARYIVSILRVEGHVAGFLALDSSSMEGIRDADRHARRIADQTALALSNVRRLHQLERLSEGTLVALARAVDAGSHWTAGHSERVADLTVRLGEEIGLGKDDLARLLRGGLLHDVGKLGVPSAVIDKAGPLTDDEFALVQQHPDIGWRILEPIDTFADVYGLVRHHHERFDGGGYPDGLSGYNIPFDARMLALADTYDALTSNRPYRKGMAQDRAIEIIRDESGRQFDPDLCEAFVNMIVGQQGAEGVKPQRATATAAMFGGGL